MSETPSTHEAKRAALSRELSEFLIELSIGVHRYAMYPVGHPSLTPVMETVLGRVSALLEDRRTLSIGIARRQLVIEGVATDQKHPVLADLARRLHGHQLGALSFARGVSGEEVSSLLKALASESEHGGTPIGLLPDEEFPTWDHVRLHRVGYEDLEIREASGDSAGMDRATALWVGLAQAATASQESGKASDAGTVARAITSHRRESAYDQVIVGYLLQLSDELKGSRGGEVEKVRNRVSRLMRELDDETLSRLVRFGGNTAQRRQFLLDANQSLAVDSVVKLLRAAAAGAGQNISNSMTRLLSKLAAHAERDRTQVGPQADAALRESVEALIEGWELEDPNPASYTAVLDEISRAAPILSVSDADDPVFSGAERVVETALEVDAYGPIVEKALSDLLDGGGAVRLLEIVGEAGEDNDAAEKVRTYLSGAAQLRMILETGTVDEAALAASIQRMGSTAIDPLLDVLAESDSREVRRRVFDALAGMGPWVAERTVERLLDGRWFVIRNMLALLQRLDTIPEIFDPHRYLMHPDARVRRAALPLALRDERRRERILAAALSDEDERMVRIALLELGEEVPEPVLPTLVNRVVAFELRTVEIRALGAKALRNTRSNLALSVLLEIAVPGKNIFGKAKLAPSSPLLLAALATLAHAWSDDPRVAPVLEVAARSKDPSIRWAALTGTSPDLPEEPEEDTP